MGPMMATTRGRPTKDLAPDLVMLRILARKALRFLDQLPAGAEGASGAAQRARLDLAQAARFVEHYVDQVEARKTGQEC
jgi:hypothetical protein